MRSKLRAPSLFPKRPQEGLYSAGVTAGGPAHFQMPRKKIVFAGSTFDTLDSMIRRSAMTGRWTQLKVAGLRTASPDVGRLGKPKRDEQPAEYASIRRPEG